MTEDNELRVTDMFAGPVTPVSCDGCGVRLSDGYRTSDGKHWHSGCVPEQYAPMMFRPIQIS